MPKITDNNEVKSQAYRGGEEALVLTPDNKLARVPFETLRSDTINYETKAEMDAAGAPSNGQMAKVWNDPTEENNGEYGWDGAAWVASGYDVKQNIKSIRKELKNDVNAIGDERIKDEDLSFSVVDEGGRSSWLAALHNGGIPDFVAKMIVEEIFSSIAKKLEEYNGLHKNSENIEGYSFYIADENENLSDIALDRHGRFSEHTKNAIRKAVEEKETLNSLVTAGDSITFGYGHNNIQWPQLLSDEIGLPLWNPSVPGEASGDIAARVGALRIELTIPDNQLPAGTTSVPVTVSPDTGWRILSGNPDTDIGQFEGVVKGFPCNLKRSGVDGSWSLNRVHSSSVAVPVSDNEKFTTQEGKKYRNGIWIIWVGRNNPSLTQIKKDIDSIIDFISPNKKIIVLSLLNNTSELSGSSGYDNIVSINSGLSVYYPEYYFDIRKWLIDYGLTRVGIDPTAQDYEDISNDIVPDSLRKDSVHPNVNGIIAISTALKELLTERGLI